MRFKNYVIFLLTIFIFSCTPKPPDVPVCEQLDFVLIEDPETHHQVLQDSPACREKIDEATCGHCVKIVSGEEFYVGENLENFFEGKPWSEIKDSSVLVLATSYAKLANYMINACKKTACSPDVNAFKIRIGKLKPAN